MNYNWNDKIQKLTDDINHVLTKEKKHKMSMLPHETAGGDRRRPEKSVKFSLPSDDDEVIY
jgi:hypothetical protein